MKGEKKMQKFFVQLLGLYKVFSALMSQHSDMSSQEMCILLFINGDGQKRVLAIKEFIEQTFHFEQSVLQPFISLQVFSCPADKAIMHHMLLALRDCVRKCMPPKKLFFEEHLQVTILGGRVILPVKKDFWLERLFSEITCIVKDPQNFCFKPHITIGKALNRRAVIHLSDSSLPTSMGVSSSEIDPFISISRMENPEKILMFAPFGRL